MTGAVAWTHQIVEGADPFTIPPRPMRVPGDGSLGVRLHEMRGRIYTFEVRADNNLIGYLRWDADGHWTARTPGGEAEPPTIKRFTDRHKAAQWLLQRLGGGPC
jgi:hypothetical protein